MTFTYQTSSLVPHEALVAATMALDPLLTNMRLAYTQGYATDYASLVLANDQALYERVMAVVDEKRALQPSLLVVIGIGGSHLGAYAVYQALHEHGHQSSLEICWADTIAPDYAYRVLARIRATLQAGNTIILTIISKSGSTIETQAYAACCIELLKEFYPQEYHRYIVVITDADSALYAQAEKDAYTILEIPKLVGGRYAVFSAIGLFPLAMLGIDIGALRAGAAGVTQDMQCDGNTSEIATSAAILALQYNNGLHIHDFFIFDPVLEGIGRWYRQLLAESIGKEGRRTVKPVGIGFMPTVSIGSTDLHSMLQRTLAGPRDTFTTFLVVATTEHDITIPQLAQQYPGKTFGQLLQAMLLGTQQTYAQYQRPFVTYRLERVDAYQLGYFMQWKMLETILLGYLLKVNPFDQPHVEAYKRATRKILDNE